MPRPTPEHPELLAPAGNLEAFFAALDHGADAVYVGLQDFSARAKARNFSLAELSRMLAYAHQHGRRVFVTLNTLVKEAELPRLAETLAALEALRVDAIILQDLAVWRLARRHFPGLELHASTQLTIHNAAGVRQLERMGFARAVLARELTLAEIAELRRQTTLELEHFIHGALCFSFSGQCSFSSWLGGKSGNRGRCAQPCRRRYQHRGKEGYFFSPNDLSAIDLLPELAAAGICSFKIEGRMKSAEYVAQVVGAYRSVLDAPPAARSELLATAKTQLRNALGRAPTRGFLSGPEPTDIAIPSLSGATGRYLGDLAQASGDHIAFRTRERVHVGDRLRIQPKSDRAGSAFTVRELQQGGARVSMVGPGSTVSLPVPFRDRFRTGDAVFKVSTDQVRVPSEASARRRLERLPPTPHPLTLHLELLPGQLRLQAQSGGFSVTREFPVETFPAEQTPLEAATLAAVFSRGGESPVHLAALTTGELPPVVIPPSRLKEIRRTFYQQLARELEDHLARSREEHLAAALASLARALPPRPVEKPEVLCQVRDGRELHLLDDRRIDSIILPLIPSVATPLLGGGARRRTEPRRIVWELPMILLGPRWEEARALIRGLIGAGYRRFRLANLGHIPLFDDTQGLSLEASYRLLTLNSEALRAWSELGIGRGELFIEDDRDNIRALLAAAEIPVGATVHSPVPLLTSRIQIRALPPGSTLSSDRDELYRVESRQGLTLLRPLLDFSLIGHLQELQALGCQHFTLDLSHVGAFSPRGKAVLEALRQDRMPPESRPFNFLHGLE